MAAGPVHCGGRPAQVTGQDTVKDERSRAAGGAGEVEEPSDCTAASASSDAAISRSTAFMAAQAAPADLRDRQAEWREQERRREAARIAAEAELAREAEGAELTDR
ncbi:hypothetical protein ACWD3J_24330 [Streptomyces sp. NPDC002755]|uniref:hypothetical protein n=1 Tax=Streptomyces sp. NPDC002884 TaxID=3154544 RepID=UPI003333D339